MPTCAKLTAFAGNARVDQAWTSFAKENSRPVSLPLSALRVKYMVKGLAFSYFGNPRNQRISVY
jgi:hypothetical protein